MTRTARRVATVLAAAGLITSLAACGADGGDTSEGQASDSTETTPPAGEGEMENEGGDQGDSGLPALFELIACDAVEAADLEAAGFDPSSEESDNEAGNFTGNTCWWEGGDESSPRHLIVSFTQGALDAAPVAEDAVGEHWFTTAIVDETSEVDGRPARRIGGQYLPEFGLGQSYPACATRIEVEADVAVDVVASIDTSEQYGADDVSRLDSSCATVDAVLPGVSAMIPN